MKKFFNLKFQISLIILITLVFTIFGYFYNKQLTQKWYLKYSIEQTNVSQVYVGALDDVLKNISLFSSSNILNSFIDKKIYKQSVVNKNTFFKNLVINPSTIAFNAEGSLETLDKNLDQLILGINKNLQNEINEFIKSLDQITQRISLLSREFKKDDLTVSLEFYEREGVEPVGLTEEASTIVEILLARTDITQSTLNLLTRLSVLLRDLKNTNSTKFLELELEKLEKLSAIEVYEFKKIRRIASLLKEQNLIKINGQMEKVNLTPDLSVSLMSFAIFGFSLSLFLCVIIGIFSSRIGIKKLKALLNLK